METVYLTRRPCDGRPAEVGSWIYGDGRHGLFVGYDDSRKYVIDFSMAEKLVKSISGKYEMEVSVHKRKELRIWERIKNRILEKIQKSLQPEKAENSCG